MLKTWWADFKRIPYVDTTWFAVWTFIYIGFLLIDISAPNFWGSSLLKYAGIFLCAIYAMQKYERDHKLVLALLFTFLADTILVWTRYELAGVFVFCFAQLLHLMRLSRLGNKYLLYFVPIVSGLVIYAGVTHENILYMTATLYGLLLFSNLAIAIRNYREHKTDFRARCAMYGYIAFVGCDVCVGLRHLMLDGVLPGQFLPLIAFMVWVFYYPSQVLLANSSTEPIRQKPIRVAKKSTIS